MTPALTTPELAARLDLDELELEQLLRDSERRGLVRRDASGRWALTPRAERRYGRALRQLGPARRGESDGGESLWHAPGEDDPALSRGCQDTLGEIATPGNPRDAGVCAPTFDELGLNDGRVAEARLVRDVLGEAGVRD